MELGFIFIYVFFIAFIPMLIHSLLKRRKQHTSSIGIPTSTKSSSNSVTGQELMTPILVACVVAHSPSNDSSSNTYISSIDSSSSTGDGGGGCD